MQKYLLDYTLYLEQLVPLLVEIEATTELSPLQYARLIKKYPLPKGGVFAKDILIKAYRELAGTHGLQPFNEATIRKITMKPVRTMSGVVPVTVLTKPFPCPGKCIFCPNDIRMPKSYLSDEPGAQRAERNFFDPYLQTYNRLQALHNIGHQLDKVEIIVLGGTWSFYPETYQIWFIKECFRALNDFGSNRDDRSLILTKYRQMVKTYQKNELQHLSDDPTANKKNLQQFQIHGQQIDTTYNQTVSQLYVAPEIKAGFSTYQSATWDELFAQHNFNESAAIRNIGLVVETRPDNISKDEVLRMRRLGCTKTQLGFQSLQDTVLTLNNRGHDVAASRRAVKLLRQAGFKIHGHWMANLYGSSVEADKQDYEVLFSDPDFKPDELKIYPCSLIESAELMLYHQQGKWQPYTYQQLLDVVTHTMSVTPRYCRLTRIIRDIPSTDIVSGNKLTNFRQIAYQELLKQGKKSVNIRDREIKSLDFDHQTITLQITEYISSVSTEYFLEFVAKEQVTHELRLLGFLRLSLPTVKSFIEELRDSAIIREIHIYGLVTALGTADQQRPQHLGLGKKLLKEAEKIASEQGFNKISVISAIGTREYYRQRGFSDGELYQTKSLKIT